MRRDAVIALRPELEAIVAELLRASEATREVSLDAIGEAIGARAIASDEVDAMMKRLEDAGRKILAPEGGGGEARLKTVVATARALSSELGRRPTVAEIAARSGLSDEDVRHALSLAQVMQR